MSSLVHWIKFIMLKSLQSHYTGIYKGKSKGRNNIIGEETYFDLTMGILVLGKDSWTSLVVLNKRNKEDIGSL